jgi:DNA processing protein
MMVEDLFSSPTPFTPPTTEEDRLDWLRLIRSRRVGATTFHRLIAEHQTARAALEALPEIARAAGVEKYQVCPIGVAEAEMRAGNRAGAKLLCFGAPAYPEVLCDLSDAPPVLWSLGDPEILALPSVAVVGARNASSLGQRMARKIAGELAEAGYCVVSGLARGIDAVAHDAALNAAGGTGATAAVHAGGVDNLYPPENAELAKRIAETGCRLSEQPPGLVPQARHFPLRNRIISGLARAVVVVEAAARSGSLITAREAAEQGREVLAVPGHPLDARADGCNQLIRDGATLIRSVSDVMEALGPVASPLARRIVLGKTPKPAPAAATPGPTLPAGTDALQQAILDRLGPSPLAEDQLIRDLALTPATVAPQLLMLELDGRVIRQPGGLLALA